MKASQGATGKLLEGSLESTNLTTVPVRSAHDMLTEQLKQVVISRQLVKQGEAILQDLWFVDAYMTTKIDTYGDCSRARSESIGKTLAKFLSFAIDKQTDEECRQKFLKDFIARLDGEGGTMDVYQYTRNGAGERISTITFNFGYVAIFRHHADRFDINCAIPQDTWKMAKRVKLWPRFAWIKRIFGCMEPIKEKSVPYEFTSEEARVLKEGFYKEKAMKDIWNGDSTLAQTIKYADELEPTIEDRARSWFGVILETLQFWIRYGLWT